MEFYFERLDVRDSGRFPVPCGTLSIGRSPKNTVVISANERCVSGIHAVVYADSRRLLIQDMQSTNGTYVNGRQVHECVLEAGDEVRLGRGGPRFMVISDSVGDGFNGYVSDEALVSSPVKDFEDVGIVDADEYMEASEREEYATHSGEDGSVAGRHNRIGVVGIIIGVGAAVLGVSALLMVMSSPKSAKQKSMPIQKDFFKLREENAPIDTEELSVDTKIDNYNYSNYNYDNDGGQYKLSQAATIEKINAILVRFGEDTNYRAQPEMVERVAHYLGLYTGSMRRTITTYMERGRRYFPMIRRTFEEKKIPIELAYVSMLESGFNSQAVSHAGAVGLWQFMPHTARRYGLEVSNNVDERTNPEKATVAAAAYFKHLIAIFGSKSSVMLCMAAYNAGEQRIINALKRIDDPMRDRDFWYLYRMGWLADETNEYIPQVIALMIIFENPAEYGFTE